MSIQFLYEDGNGMVVDECGRPEPMDYIVDEEQYALETVSSYTQFMSSLVPDRDNESNVMQTVVRRKADVVTREVPTKRNYTLYTDQDKVRFFQVAI
jgi:hypothetical protein